MTRMNKRRNSVQNTKEYNKEKYMNNLISNNIPHSCNTDKYQQCQITKTNSPSGYANKKIYTLKKETAVDYNFFKDVYFILHFNYNHLY